MSETVMTDREFHYKASVLHHGIYKPKRAFIKHYCLMCRCVMEINQYKRRIYCLTVCRSCINEEKTFKKRSLGQLSRHGKRPKTEYKRY